MRIEDQIFIEVKPFINQGNVEGLQHLWNEYHNEIDWDTPIAWDYVFQKSYLHAALKKQKEICIWLDTLFPTFDPITQIALRQLFPYARYLLTK
jgi:hypothetical protein|uniref:Uncharacterized protein n=1 Tax=viral metagenome TaxID=1070528 RepID=A0A6C0BG55_9ZZZZ